MRIFLLAALLLTGISANFAFGEIVPEICCKKGIPFYLKPWCGASFCGNRMNETDLCYKPGIAAGLAAGTPFLYYDPLRFECEVEGMFLQNSFSHVKTIEGNFKIGGHVREIAFFGNLFVTGNLPGGFSPYFGSGIGFGNEHCRLIIPGMFDVHHSEWGVAYQIIGGLSYTLSCISCMNAALLIEGRYLRFDESINTGIVDVGFNIDF